MRWIPFSKYISSSEHFSTQLQIDCKKLKHTCKVCECKDARFVSARLQGNVYIYDITRIHILQDVV